mmetsp:Transcript_9230/g.19102  ORF Transcript_9230/g.19102 Transcript_9230/m.19102 type:complete len:91 (+) Transcript_9230:665-937(+)
MPHFTLLVLDLPIRAADGDPVSPLGELLSPSELLAEASEASPASSHVSVAAALCTPPTSGALVHLELELEAAEGLLPPNLTSARAVGHQK